MKDIKGVYNGLSIECISAEIISRKIIFSSYKQIKNVGNCLMYKCSMNSEAKISKELNPKKALHNDNSYLNLNDKLEAENMSVYVNMKKRLVFGLINHSASHKAQTTTTSNYTYAVITRQIPCIPLLDPPIIMFKEVLLEE